VDTGEINWPVPVAVDREISTPFIALAVMQLFQSRGSGKDGTKAEALLRHGYGGHPFGKDERIAEGRKTSRITKL
jgi:6-phosphogluconate dehydrogenase